MATRKPKTIEVGKCYRINYPYGGGYVSESTVYVHAIEGKKQRCVCLRTVAGPELGWNAASYSEFMRMVHSEAPTLMN